MTVILFYHKGYSLFNKDFPINESACSHDDNVSVNFLNFRFTVTVARAKTPEMLSLLHAEMTVRNIAVKGKIAQFLLW